MIILTIISWAYQRRQVQQDWCEFISTATFITIKGYSQSLPDRFVFLKQMMLAVLMRKMMKLKEKNSFKNREGLFRENVITETPFAEGCNCSKK